VAKRQSLLKPAQQELSILADVPAEAQAIQYEVGVYSGDLFFKHDRKRYELVTWLLGQGVGKMRIAKSVGVSIHTVMAVAEREGETIASLKKSIASSARRGCGLMVEEIISDLESGKTIPTRDKAIIAGILKDVAAHMDGEAQIRIEAVISAPSHDQFNQELQQAVGVEVLPTGLDGETRGQKGDAAGGSAGGSAAAGGLAGGDPAAAAPVAEWVELDSKANGDRSL
jgi:hypothetical protein